MFFSVASPSGAEDRKFTIGMILPLTGNGSDYGDAMQKAVLLAQKDFPQHFQSIRFIYEDAAYDPRLAVQAFKKLREIDKVDLIYVWGVTFCKALAAIAQSFRAPLVAQCIDHQSAKNRPYVIRFMNYTDQYIAVLLKYLRGKGYKNFGAVLGDNPFAEDLFRSFQAQLETGESVTIIDRYVAGQYEMRSTLTKIRAASYDAVGVFLSLSQIAQFYKQRHEQRLSFPTFGTNFFESLSEIRASGNAMSGAVYPSNRVRQAFFDRFTASYGPPNQLAYAALTYEFALLIGKEFSDHPATNPEEVVRRLTQIGPQAGVATGPYAFRDLPEIGRYFEFDLVMKVVQGDSVCEIGSSGCEDP